MRLNIRNLGFGVAGFTILPILTYLILSVVGVFNSIAIGNAFFILIVLTIVVAYLLLAYNHFKERRKFDTLLSLLYYINFLIYMVTTLISFNLLVIGGFLFTDQVPMGLEINPDQALSITCLGIYVLCVCILGMYTVYFSKKQIQTQIT